MVRYHKVLGSSRSSAPIRSLRGSLTGKGVLKARCQTADANGSRDLAAKILDA